MKRTMIKQCPRLVGIFFGMLLAGQVVAGELRQPLPLIWGYWHYPMPRPKDFETAWNIDTWGAGYFRSAHRMFIDHESLETENIDAAFFGVEDFFGIQAFTPGTPTPLDPFLQFSLISPRIAYSERGAFFGLTIDHTMGCENEWHVGVRGTIPFRDILVELDSCCADLEEGSLDQVRRLEREQVVTDGNSPSPATVNNAFAYRLDFLSKLALTVNAPQEPLVIYANPSSNNNITMNQINVTDANDNPINVISRPDGTVPPAPFSLRATGGAPDVASLPFLAADGSGLANNARARFDQAVNYTPLGANVTNQSRLWVVPTAETTGNVFDVTANASNIRTIVEAIIAGLQSSSAIGFFEQNGFDFNNQRTTGPGDINLEFYGQRQWCTYFIEMLGGLRFPTGKRVRDPKLVFKMPAGNNGHLELYAGLMGGWQGLEWLHIKADGRYYFAVPRQETVAGTFVGATVKGLGPITKAKVSWHYFVGDLDFTFLPRCNPRVGLDLGYQIYVKGKNHVKYILTQAFDLLGNVGTLSPDVLANRTDVTAHRVRAEIFHQSDYAEIFGGWMHTFAGKNAFKDTDWYLGMMIYF